MRQLGGLRWSRLSLPEDDGEKLLHPVGIGRKDGNVLALCPADYPWPPGFRK